MRDQLFQKADSQEEGTGEEERGYVCILHIAYSEIE